MFWLFPLMVAYTFCMFAMLCYFLDSPDPPGESVLTVFCLLWPIILAMLIACSLRERLSRPGDRARRGTAAGRRERGG